MNHFILKLTSGEIVYGIVDLENTDKKMVAVENPLVWEEYDSPEGHTGSALVRYMVGTSDITVPIAAASITSMAAMSPKFTAFYDAAVEVQKITGEAYDENLTYMTGRMIELVMDYQAKVMAADTSGIVAYNTDTKTIH